ncbi:MAG: NAD kinase [Devosiaceae bacterium]|nr:NAD kinase [Devosiaceae bacterium]
MPVKSKHIHFVSSGTPEADQATKTMIAKYGDCQPENADVIVVLGGDGQMLQTLHSTMNPGNMDLSIPVYGMNFGSIGFLMNAYNEDDLHTRIETAKANSIHPLKMQATDEKGNTHTALALNEVSLFRSSSQAAKIEIFVDGKSRISELICDGVLLATPAGSTAYNLSAHGPILPIDSPLLALTPISPFRPRRWRGAILPNSATVQFSIIKPKRRPVSVVADNRQYSNVAQVTVKEDRTNKVTLLFDPGHSLEERVLNEQFKF